MPKYTSTWLRNKSEKFEAAVRGMHTEADNRHRLVIQTSADDEIRVKFVKSTRPFGLHAAGAPLAPIEAFEKGLLDYKHNSRLLTEANEKPAAEHGSKGITKYGRRTMREACAVLEDKFGKDVAFVTLTLPGSTKEAIAMFAEHSSEILDAFFQRVRKQYKGESQPVLYAGVWELQKRGALHIHVAIGLHSPEMFKDLERNHRRWWCHILKTYSKNTGVDLFGRAEGGTWAKRWRKTQTDCQKIKKSAKRYMSKYLTKSITPGGDINVPTPKRWWFVARDLREEVLARRQSEVFLYDDISKAQADCDALVFMAKDDAQASFAMCNPFNNEVVGYQLYYGEATKDAVYQTLCALMRDGPGREALEAIKQHIYIRNAKSDVAIAA